MTKISKFFLGAALPFIAACTNQTAGDIPFQSDLGEAVASNQIVQTAYLGGGDALLVNLQSKFERESPTVINFDFDRSTLDGEATSRLDQQVAWLKKNEGVRVRIYGHTDLVGSEGYNDGLGLRRARAAMRYLVSKGIASDRLEAVESRGEREPLVNTQERERANRRTETIVIGFSRLFLGDGLDGRRADKLYRRYAGDAVEKPADVTTDGSGGGGN